MNKKLKIKNTDLHTHSIYSDGFFLPKEVVEEAKKKKIKNLSLTDHNSVEGVEEAINAGKLFGIKVIPGVEIRAKEDEVLGYFIDYQNPDFKKEVKKLQMTYIKIVKFIIKEINKKGIKISYKDILKEYRPNNNLMEIHVIRYLNKIGHGEIKDLWKRYMPDIWKSSVYSEEISVADAIKLIIQYGGVPVLAHPWVEPSSRELLLDKNFKEVVRTGLQGIEIDNGDRDERRNDKILNKINILAERYNLVITSGSDFHGDEKSRELNIHQIGEHNCEESVIGKLKLKRQK